MSYILETVARTNDAWENLKILRELKKKHDAYYSKGLINSDEGKYYCVVDYGDYDIAIHTDNDKGFCSEDSSFNFDKYFKNSNRILTKGSKVYFVHASRTESALKDISSYSKIYQGTFVGRTEYHTFTYGIIKSTNGKYVITPLYAIAKSKKVLIDRIVEDQKEELERKKTFEIKRIEETIKRFEDMRDDREL